MMPPEQVKQIRSGMKMTQRQFAVVVGVSASAVGRWESGSLKVSAAHEKLLAYLDRPMPWSISDIPSYQ